MADPPLPATQSDAHVAPNAAFNTLRPSVTFAGAVLWPAFRTPAPAPALPAAQKGKTGTVQNHWHHRPGQLNASPAPPAWAVAETFTEAEYEYDKQYPGLPLPNVDVDLFHASAGIDCDDYAKFSELYTRDEPHEGRVKSLTVRFTAVDVVNDEDWFGKGEIVFKGSIDGKAAGETREMSVGSGARGVALAWKDEKVASVEIDVLSRTDPIALELSGVDRDVGRDDPLGAIAAQIKPPWPQHRTSGSAVTKDFVAYWEMTPKLATEEERIAAKPKDDPKKAQTDKLLEALIGSRKTDAQGRFTFKGLRAGEFVLFLRGRLAFVEIAFPGGEVLPPPPVQHNGVKTAALNAARGAHRLWLKVKVDASGSVQILTKKNGAEAPYDTDRLLDPGQTIKDMKAETPYRFYALPLVVASNTAQRDACAAELGHAFKVTATRAADALGVAAFLDLAALQRFACAERSSDPGAARILAEGAVDDLLKHTLLLGGPAADRRTMVFDHAHWAFADATATAKTRGRFVPLGTEGTFTGQSLYAAAVKTKDSYGRFALRFTDPALEGRDVRELKTRLVLWGSAAHFIDLRNDRFDQTVREALLRFKRDRALFRLRVAGTGDTADNALSTLTSIVDADTFRALDLAQPSIGLAGVADTEDPVTPGQAVLTAEGYNRVLFYAAEISRRRIAPANAIHIHSSFRTLAHNRRVYLGIGHELRWRLASNAGPMVVEHSGFTTTVQGVTGADGTIHAANALATQASARLDAPRGTYWGEAGATWAADYSKHTTGKAIDYDLGRNGNVTRVQWDTEALVLFGASRTQHVPGKLWLEQRKVGAAAGTSDWIHLDTGDLPVDVDEYVLTDADVRGPRWDASIIVRGTVTRAGAPRLGARVDLSFNGAVVATTYADRHGRYSLRLGGGAAGGYVVRATFAQPYPFQAAPAEPVAPAVSPPVAVNIAWPGDEGAADLVIP